MENNYLQNEGPVYEDIPPVSTEKLARAAFSRIALSAAVYTVVSYAAVILISLLLGLLLRGTDFIAKYGSSVTMIVSTLPLYIFGLPVFYLLVRDMPVCRIEGAHVTVIECVVIFFVSRAFLLSGSLISQGLVSLFERILGHAVEDTTSEMISSVPLWLMTLLVVIIAPVMEEIIYRKLMIDRLRAYGDMPAILFSAALFGLGHGNFFQFLYAFLLGLLLGYLYVRSGKLIFPILLHMITNFLGSVAVMPIMRLQEEYNAFIASLGENFEWTKEIMPYIFRTMQGMYSYVGITYGMTIIGIVLFVRCFPKILVRRATLPELGRHGTLNAAVFNVGVIVFAVITIAEMTLSLIR